MKSTTKFIGLDVSKEKISVAIADEGKDKPRYYGTIAHAPAALRKLIKELGPASSLSFCYEPVLQDTKPTAGSNPWGPIVSSLLLHSSPNAPAIT
ncbi:hypothetical protein MHI48_29185 [Paenibacillus sp. FSL H7-0942]|uniref:hypothetical protein n=1 Tax=Paenibacillus sp. FSL H7-0942 TaxID=2921444 RepID=UPI003250C508